MTTVIVKNPSTNTRNIAPMFGIHLPLLRDMIATMIENQMKISLKR